MMTLHEFRMISDGTHPEEFFGEDWAERLTYTEFLQDDESGRWFYMDEQETGTPGEDGYSITTKRIYID